MIPMISSHNRNSLGNGSTYLILTDATGAITIAIQIGNILKFNITLQNDGEVSGSNRS